MSDRCGWGGGQGNSGSHAEPVQPHCPYQEGKVTARQCVWVLRSGARWGEGRGWAGRPQAVLSRAKNSAKTDVPAPAEPELQDSFLEASSAHALQTLPEASGVGGCGRHAGSWGKPRSVFSPGQGRAVSLLRPGLRAASPGPGWT